MNYSPVELLYVFFHHGGIKMPLGRLAVKDRQILFEYDPTFIDSELEISPFELPLKEGVQICTDRLFQGLFGVFNDSLPDGWGRLLLDRQVEKHGINRRQLTALDRLSYVGTSGMGALSYEPDLTNSADIKKPIQLDVIAEEARIVLEGTNDEVFEELLALGGSSGGARPKIVAQVNRNRTELLYGQDVLKEGYEHWLIKFPASADEKDIGTIEYAYSLMAKQAGVEMPSTHLFTTQAGNAYFGVKRFDREGIKRIHMHTLCGLLHADHQNPALDYQDILRATHKLTRDFQELLKAFRLACFNVFAHNQDDHSKNFSFIFDHKNEWKLSPAYDLTYSFSSFNEHSTTIMGEGKAPNAKHLHALAKSVGIKEATAVAIISEVKTATNNWRAHASEAGVSVKSTKMVDENIVD